MGRAFWVGDRLYHLLNLPYAEFRIIYPDVNLNTYKGKRSYWNKKIANGEILMPPKPQTENFGEVLKLHGLSPDLAQQFTDQGFHVGYIKNNEGEIEYTIPLPRARTSNRVGLDDFPQAQPARITPSKRKPVERDHRVIYAFSDAQIGYRRLEDGTLVPLHDESALAVGRMICKDVRPDLIVNLGDTVDLAELSRFKPDSDHFMRTIGPAFQRAHDYLAELRADNPDAEMVEVDSNHNTRLANFVKTQAPMFYGMKIEGERYDVLSYPYLARLGHLGVRWIGGYPAAEYVYGEEYGKPPIVFKHGKIANSGGSTAKTESNRNQETHIVRGHTHAQEWVQRTNRAGQYLSSIVVGVSCSITGEVPGYYSAVDDDNRVVKYQENHQQGVLVIRDYQGDYEFVPIPINKGVAHFQGKRYQA